MFGLKRRRRQRLRRQAFPARWSTAIQTNVPYYHLLTPAEQVELYGHVLILMHEKRFEGCGGLSVTDEIRATIAAQAAILLLGRETDYYPKLRTILVYPTKYIAETARRLPGGMIIEGPEARLGEAWYRGALVLSWEDVLRGAANPADGDNVVFHEFAHQLDSESGANEGAPDLPTREARASWARVFEHEFRQLIEELHLGHPTVLRPYAATNPAEFFAVATEYFFELPYALRTRHPALYREMAAYFHQDPARRFVRLRA
jgi:Mlc titration factor MtfA (ptsG expression regulator)